MSEPKLISPLLDNFAMGDAISDRGGIRICPAMDQASGDKFIVKIISNPATPTQLDALVLSGAYPSREQALEYYRSVSEDILKETQILGKLSELDGFVSFAGSQINESDDGSGYDVYLLSPYRMSLDRYWAKEPMTHLSALNLGLDLCSALTVCRRCGYLYVGISAENVYYIEDKGFKIGDIGFIPLSSLKYASLPDRYRSEYTPPEIEDAYASINTTADVYAVGLLLYQVFNGGVLPNMSETAIPAPEFADYEVAEIILKACAKDPAARWEDPAQLGQALVDYMQRNGAHDTPIVPVPAEIPVVEPAAEDAPAEDAPQPVTDETVANEYTGSESVTADAPYSEDALGNLSFLAADEDLADSEEAEAVDAQITDEVSDMLNQADELIAHETPAPVIPPEPIDVQLPPEQPQEQSETAEDEIAEAEAPSEPEAETAEDEEVAASAESAEVAEEPEAVEATATTEADPDDGYEDYEPRRKSHWVRNTLIALITLCLLAGGFLFYKFYYLQHIISLGLDGKDFSLTVHVNTEADESLLNVICYDTYGNQLQSPVVNGKAVFDELAPDCAYTVKVTISGFHSLTGQIATNYSTPKQTNIVQFSAVTGAEDGSAILNFSVDGPDLKDWIIRRSAQDEATEEFPCTEHTYTFTGLTVGKEYTFELLSAEGKQIIGATKLTHTASKLVNAVDPMITSCQDSKLTLTWKAPADTQVSKWSIHCFNDKGYDQTLTVTELTATFEGIVANDPYTVEITADGMSVNQRLFVPENAVTVSNFAVTKSDSISITLSWTNGSNTPEGGWILQYTLDGSPVNEVKVKSGETVTVTPYIPDSTYTFTLLTADSKDVVGGKLTYKTKEASDFSGYSVKRSNLNFSMCLTPNVSNWKKKDVRSSDYTTDFKIGQKASFLVRINKKYGVSSTKLYVTFVIRDSEGKVVSYSTKQMKWSNMWENSYGEFDLQALPKTAGKYTVTAYFNDAIAGKENFKMK